MKKVNVTKINYTCGCVGEVYQEQDKDGNISLMWTSDKKVVCPHIK